MDNKARTDDTGMLVPVEKSKEKRAAHTKPPFTLADIKKAVPPHCFNRPLLHSFSYLLFDLMIAFFLYHIATTYILTPNKFPPKSYSSKLTYFVYWIIYSLLQGTIQAALWFIGHECGHNAFCDYEWLGDIVGFIVHQSALIPYFSFKYSHRRHHSRTASLQEEEVFAPMRKSDVPAFVKYLKNPIPRFLALSFLLTAGVPLYLMVNFRGRQYDQFASHFYPNSPMYTPKQRNGILLSDAAMVAVMYGLYKVALIKGLAWLVFIYGGPYLVLNAIVIGVTVLQHTHTAAPYYDSEEWDWLRGSLGTIDRDFGFLNHLLHEAPNTHVAHHLFPSMPHYHCEEATEAFKPILGDYYTFDDTSFLKAMWGISKDCVFVEEDEDDPNGVFWYKSI